MTFGSLLKVDVYRQVYSSSSQRRAGEERRLRPPTETQAWARSICNASRGHWFAAAVESRFRFAYVYVLSTTAVAVEVLWNH